MLIAYHGCRLEESYLMYEYSIMLIIFNRKKTTDSGKGTQSVVSQFLFILRLGVAVDLRLGGRYSAVRPHVEDDIQEYGGETPNDDPVVHHDL